MRYWLAATTLLAGTLLAPDASALLLENTFEDGELMYFYPYPTSYRQVDPGYAFDDDPLSGFVHKPYIMPIEVVRAPVRRTLVQPRLSFVPEMYRSTDVL